MPFPNVSARVIREPQPVAGFDLWIDRQPHKGIDYYHVSALKFTYSQARLLEAVLNGQADMSELLATMMES